MANGSSERHNKEGERLRERRRLRQRPEEEKVYPLFVKNLETGVTNEFPAVSNYLFAEEKEALVFISEGKDSTFEAGIYVINLPENSTQKIFDGKENSKNSPSIKPGKKLLLLATFQQKRKRMTPNTICTIGTKQKKHRKY
jgi:hypothetical protein